MKTSLLIGIAAAVIVAGGLAVWFVFGRAPASNPNTISRANSGLADATTIGGSATSQGQNQQNGVQAISGAVSTQKIFKIADGPVSGATFTQTFNPTTTLARFVLQENGHVMDQPIDVAGTLPRAVSNTTIPGTASVVWGKGGSGAYMQYTDSGVVKTVSLSFPAAATSSRSVTKPVQIQFLPDNARAVAVSPSGAQVAYLLPSASGSDGYVANTDGGNAKKLFSVGLKELLLSWPSTGTLLLATKSDASAPGAAFSVDAKTGIVTPLLYAAGLSALADASFSRIVYQSLNAAGDARYTYSRDLAKNQDFGLSFDPAPEQCAWSNIASAVLYCAVANQYAPSTYADDWHKGSASLTDAIASYNAATGVYALVATPGTDGGEQSDILQIAVSPDDKYLLFVKKGDRSLWGVRLAQ